MLKMHPWSSNVIFGAPMHYSVTSLASKQVVGHTLSYILSKFEVNLTNSCGDIDNFVHPL